MTIDTLEDVRIPSSGDQFPPVPVSLSPAVSNDQPYTVPNTTDDHFGTAVLRAQRSFKPKAKPPTKNEHSAPRPTPPTQKGQKQIEVSKLQGKAGADIQKGHTDSQKMKPTPKIQLKNPVSEGAQKQPGKNLNMHVHSGNSVMKSPHVNQSPVSGVEKKPGVSHKINSGSGVVKMPDVSQNGNAVMKKPHTNQSPVSGVEKNPGVSHKINSGKGTSGVVKMPDMKKPHTNHSPVSGVKKKPPGNAVVKDFSHNINPGSAIVKKPNVNQSPVSGVVNVIQKVSSTNQVVKNPKGMPPKSPPYRKPNHSKGFPPPGHSKGVLHTKAPHSGTFLHKKLHAVDSQVAKHSRPNHHGFKKPPHKTNAHQKPTHHNRHKWTTFTKKAKVPAAQNVNSASVTVSLLQLPAVIMNFLLPYSHQLPDAHNRQGGSRSLPEVRTKPAATYAVPESPRRRPIIDNQRKTVPARPPKHRPRTPCLTCANTTSPKAKSRSLFSTISAASGIGRIVDQISGIPKKISAAASSAYGSALERADSASNSLESYNNNSSGAGGMPMPTLSVLSLLCTLVVLAVYM